MLRVLTNTQRLFQSVWKRTLATATVPPVDGQEVAEEEKVAIDPDDNGLGASEAAPAVKETYSIDAIARLKLDQYPFYVEREWWKKGKRMTFWATWRQLRDIKRREHVAEAIRDDAAAELSNMPKNAHPRRILNMCMFTARQRGKIKPYRINRHLFRKLADHSKLSGVQRAMW
ncbi:ribosomal protein S14p/S29e [Cooperia oncophora]